MRPEANAIAARPTAPRLEARLKSAGGANANMALDYRRSPRRREATTGLLLTGHLFGLGPLAVRPAHLEDVHPLLVALLGEGVVERDAPHRARQLAGPDHLVPLPAGGARGVPLAVVADGGAHEPLRALVVAPEAFDLDAGVLLGLLLFVAE